MAGGRSDPGVAVRVATAGDCGGIAAVEHDVGGIDAALSLARCVEQALDPALLLVVAEAGGEIVGFGRAGAWDPPDDAPLDAAPPGWYLLGLLVRDAWRRRGVGSALTRRRLDWIGGRTDRAYYFANARNDASIELHRRLGFVERTRDFWFPNTSFGGGGGVLFEAHLAGYGGLDR